MQGTASLRRIVSTALCAALLFVPNVSFAAPRSEYATYQIVAKGMCCQGCAKKVASQLFAAPGVVDVKADVPNRTVTVTAKPSPKLTLEKLWSAVEKGKGEPSQLTTSEAVYTLTRPEQLKDAAASSTSVYAVHVANMHDMQQAERIAAHLKAIRGIESLSVDLEQGVLLVKAAAKVQLSPWALSGAVGQAGESAVAVNGPHGEFTIDAVTEQATRSIPVAR